MSSKVDLTDIVRNRAQVNALLRKSAKSKPDTTKSISWISPHERHLPIFKFDSIDDPKQIISLATLHFEIFEHRKIKAHKIPKLLVPFEESIFPDSAPPRPTLDEVQGMVQSGFLNIAVYSTEGYNYTLEYAHVYNGESTPETTFEDIAAVAARAARAIDTSISPETAKMYAEYMLRMAAWEIENAKATCLKTLSQHLPYIKAQVYDKMNFYSPHIYIGMDDGMNLCFWIRICPAMESQSEDTGDQRDVDISFEKHSCFYFYHRYKLTISDCEELDLAGFADSSTGEETEVKKPSATAKKTAPAAIPPPPKPPKKDDVFVGLILRNSDVKRRLASSDSTEVDVSVEIDDDQMGGIVSNRDDLLRGRQDDEADEAHVSRAGATPRRPPRTPRTPRTPSHMKEIKSLQAPSPHPPAGTTAESPATTDKKVIVNAPMDGEKAGGVVAEQCLVSPPYICNPSPFAELLGWGRNTAFLFDKSLDKLKSNKTTEEAENEDGEGGSKSDPNYVCFNPASIAIPPSVNLERVCMVACSHRHMLLLTYNGSVYSCGDNTEGALGLGDSFNRTALTLILWPVDSDVAVGANPTNPLAAAEAEGGDEEKKAPSEDTYRKIVCIAAGSSAIGSHSMALSEDGKLYGWGVPYATGHGVMEPSLSPKLVEVPSPLPEEDALALPAPPENDPVVLEGAAEVPPLPPARVKHVACGGGFTVAVLTTGHVASFGMWAHGRLGLGPAPVSKINRGAGAINSKAGRSKKKVVRYQLKPRIIPGITNAVKISCGEAHTLCVCTNGKVYAWGQNSCGQLGTGPTPSGFLRDATSPVRVTFGAPSLLTTESSKHAHHPLPSIKIVDVCCGTFHSLACDSAGRVWSWGGRGDTCLGHDDPPLSGSWTARAQNIFSTSAAESKIMVPYELYQWCRTWSLPRHVRALGGNPELSDDVSYDEDTIVQLSAGDMHSAFLYDTGRFYMCGGGPVVPPMTSKDIDDDDDTKADDESKDTQEKIDEAIDAIQSRMVPVTTPRCPSSMWMDRVAVRSTNFICSAGSYIVVVQDEDLIGASLTEYLLSQATNNNHITITSDVIPEDGSMSTAEAQRQALPPLGRGKADCMLLAAGRILIAHRAILATRCAQLREKLIEEAPMDDGLPGSKFTPTQILLPDLVVDTARAFHVFLYTGTIPPKCVKNLSVVQGLQRCARRFRIPRLKAACDRLVEIHNAIAQSIEDEEDEEEEEDTAEAEGGEAKKKKQVVHSVLSGLNLELPPSTLGRDMGSLVGDSQYADIRFIAEGRSLSAHRFILEARCEYFRIMFGGGMAEAAAVSGSDEEEGPAVVDIVVPDSFVGLLRFLIFLYTDILPDGSDGALLEDLMSADRYQVAAMKRLCESMLVPSRSNWLDLLRAAYLFNSPHLEVAVLGFLRDNVGNIAEMSDFSQLSEEFPNLLSDVMELRQLAYPLPPSQALITHASTIGTIVREKNSKFHMPLWALGLGLVAAFAYQHIARVVALGPVVPVINALAFVGVIMYFYHRVLMAD